MIKKYKKQIEQLETKINKIIREKEQNEEIDIILAKIKKHIKNNPYNIFTLKFDDLTEHFSVINVDNMKYGIAK